MAPRKPKPAPTGDPRWVSKDEFWFKAAAGAPVHDRVVAHGKALRSLYSSAHKRDRVHERLYEGTDLKRNGSALQILREQGFSVARLNVVESVINTVVSRLSKSRPMPSIVVDDADWSLKRKSKQYRKFIVGEMLQTDFDARSKEALLDGGVIGVGLTTIDDCGNGDRVIAERMLREELFYDPRECKYGKPWNAIRIRRFARDHLMELYPEFARQIQSAEPSLRLPSEDLDDDTSTTDLDDYVDVFEAIHRERQEGDGRRALCIDNATLVAEPWEFPRFPWATFKWQKPRRGVWSRGLVHKLKDIQHRINCIVRDIQMNIQAVGRGHYLMQEGMALPTEALTGFSPFVMKYKGNQPPQWNAPAPFSQAQIGALEFFINQAYELPGTSRLSATSKSSLGAGASGVALDTQYDIESDRYAMEESQYADYRLEAAQLYIDASKRVAKKRKDGEARKPYVSGFQHGDAIEKLEHDKVSLETDQYKLQLEPVGFLPTTRAGKLSAVGQLSQAGIIPQWLAAAMFDEPDLMRANRITLGAFWNCERKMEILADPDADMPTVAPWNDFELEMTMTKAYLNNAEAEKAPAEVVQRYSDYLDDITEAVKMKKQGEAALAPPMPMDPSMPGAAPMLPPGAPMPIPEGGSPPLTSVPPMAA